MNNKQFRAWNIAGTREMSPTFGLNCQELWDWCEKHGIECELDGEIMQYTGLKDRNGKGIFEGDIVETWADIEGSYIREVKMLNDRPELTFIPNSGFILCENNTRHFEVIGNIYENPELLNK